MPRDLEADLKLCESINVGSSSFHLGNFAASASIGWTETILELMEARKKIADFEIAVRELCAVVADQGAKHEVAIAAAVLAEREACAAIVDEAAFREEGSAVTRLAGEIRARGE